MIGAVVRSRSRLQSSTPSMSGRPRSRMTTSGWTWRTTCSDSVPVIATRRRWFFAVNAACNARSRPGSSSTTRTRGPVGPFLASFVITSSRRHREAESEAGTAEGRLLGVDGAVVRFDDGAADGEADAARRARLTATEGLEQSLALEGQRAGTGIVDPHLDHAVRHEAADVDRRADRRVARGVLEQVDHELLDERVVAVDEWQLRR